MWNKIKAIINFVFWLIYAKHGSMLRPIAYVYIEWLILQPTYHVVAVWSPKGIRRDGIQHLLRLGVCGSGHILRKLSVAQLDAIYGGTNLPVSRVLIDRPKNLHGSLLHLRILYTVFAPRSDLIIAKLEDRVQLRSSETSCTVSPMLLAPCAGADSNFTREL